MADTATRGASGKHKRKKRPGYDRPANSNWIAWILLILLIAAVLAIRHFNL